MGKRTHTYYARITSERAIILPLRIVTKEQFYAEKPPTDTLIGLYFGILFALVIYNIFLFVGLRDIAYLYYVLSIVSTFVLLSTSSGHFFQYILPDNPSLNMLMFPFSVATLVSFSSLFTQSFLKIKEDNKFLHHALSWVRYITIATIPALLVFDDMIVTQSHYILLFILIILLLSSGIVSWRKGNRFAIYYVFAWFGYFLGGIVSMLSEQNAVPFVFATRYGAQIGSAMEVLLLSMALSRRYNAYKKEKEDAMRKALEIEKEANETLEKKVTLRTLQLKETNEELNQINEELSTTLELVEVEKRKSDKLLLNILPADVAQELKNYGIATPKRYERVTILFTDFKGFTALVAQMNPEQVLANLNYCFTAFDKIARKHHLEKIKTIGDSYMCVGGLPVAEPNNPIYAVEAALEMMTFMREWKTKKEKQGKEAWDIRIGIHTGEVVAGVVGDYKFAYDIWGDDVNTASRMESSGEAGKINISHTTYEIVKNNFICTHRGKINAKSKGEIDMYFVESKL
ncbi:MAG: hypothetical protein EAZ95_11650 [Bacteroidetes bacterium]|nr:MAG: hypothetical protein EAZ95_11650 [Bacteroidota bacterium]